MKTSPARLAIIICTLTFLSCPIVVLADEWLARSNMLTGRQEIYADTVGGIIYVPGGILRDMVTTTASLEAFIAAENRWVELAPLPEPRHHITPAIVGGKLYAAGGFDGPFPQWAMKSDLFVYDIQSDTWTKAKPLPGPRGEHVAAVVDERIHIIGGRVPGESGRAHFDAYIDTSSHYIYDPAANEWTNGRPASTARNSAAAAVIDGLIYVVGGRANIMQDDGTQLQHNLHTLEVYDSKTDDWRALSPMPEALGGIAAAALGGKLYVFGGEQWTPEQKVFASTWVYDPKSDNWARTSELPTARHGLAAATVGETIYTFGGCLKVGGGAAIGTTEALTP